MQWSFFAIPGSRRGDGIAQAEPCVIPARKEGDA